MVLNQINIGVDNIDYDIRIIPYKHVCTLEDLEFINLPYKLTEVIGNGNSIKSNLLDLTTVVATASCEDLDYAISIFDKIRNNQDNIRIKDYRWILKTEIHHLSKVILNPRILGTSVGRVVGSQYFFKIKVTLTYEKIVDIATVHS